MPGAVYESEQLRYRIHEVDGLRHEEQNHGLAEVTQYSHRGKRHSGEVAESITNKNFGGVSV